MKESRDAKEAKRTSLLWDPENIWVMEGNGEAKRQTNLRPMPAHSLHIHNCLVYTKYSTCINLFSGNTNPTKDSTPLSKTGCLSFSYH